MAFQLKFMVRYGSMVALLKVHEKSKIEDVESIVYTKWPQLVGFRFKLSCQLGEFGECFLEEDDEIGSVYSICKDAGISRCDVHVQVDPSVRGQIGGPSSMIVGNQSIMSFVNYDAGLNDVDQGIDKRNERSSGKRLLSDEWKDIIKHEGQLFYGGVDEFRKALTKYAVENTFEYRTLKNEPHRLTAICQWKDETDCPWRIHASHDKAIGAFVVRRFVPEHTCGVISTKESTKKLKARGVTELIAETIRNMPGITPRDVQAQVRERYGVNISYHVAWRSTEAARALIFGDHSKSYSYIPAYFAEAERTNPDSVFDLEVNPETNNFIRCFFAFGACIQGFKSCRPVLLIDGTFLKGKHRGILLSAVGKDGDEGLYPVAFAIVSEETIDNWRWFLERLKRIVEERRELVIVSDRHQGIIDGVKKVFPDAKHGFCYNHLVANLKDKLRGSGKDERAQVLRLFASCAYVSTRQEFDRLYAELVALGGKKIRNFMADKPRESWSNAYFTGRRFGQMTSNGVESWNAQIRQQRLLPITNLIDSIRILLMTQLNERRTRAANWSTVLCKSADRKVRDLIEKGRSWLARQSSELIWEVFSTPRAIVDLGQRACSCRAWQIGGFPCVHAVAVIFIKLDGAYQYIDECYHTKAYVEAYKHSITPFVNESIDTGGAVINPPDVQVRRGRPKRKRLPSRGEHTPRKIRCGTCGKLGRHNKQSCNGAES